MSTLALIADRSEMGGGDFLTTLGIGAFIVVAYVFRGRKARVGNKAADPLLEQAMGEGVIRRVSLPVLQRMISASIEDFLADRTLDAQGISYTDALNEMISILLEGLLVRGDTVFAITGNLQSNGAMPSVGVNLLAVVRCVCPIPAGSCRSTTQTPLTMRWSAVTVAH